MKQNKSNKAKKSNKVKKLLSKYSKTIIFSIMHSFAFAFNISLLTAASRIAGIKAGEYPEQPMDIRLERLSEAMPKIIIESVIMGLLIMMVFFIITLMISFRKEYNIYLFYELKLYLKEKRRRKKNDS